ncbi:MAG: hypothetical protein ACYCWW_11775 [Deltaproteobacteria bacterium]
MARQFRFIPESLVSYERDDDEVDLIPGVPSPRSDGPVDIPFELCRGSFLTVPGHPRLPVASPGVLVGLKALAWRGRRGGRDLADIAALALAGQELGWSMDADVARVVSSIAGPTSPSAT